MEANRKVISSKAKERIIEQLEEVANLAPNPNNWIALVRVVNGIIMVHDATYAINHRGTRGGGTPRDL